MTMKRILTGDRPTGRLHIGHYVGSLSNRVKLQHDYDTFIEIADIQALTTHFERPELISDSIMQVAIDNLSVGLDPEKVTLFLQSQIPSIAELTIFYSMFVTMNTLRHNPTVKTEAAQYGYDDMTYGFIGYPVSQAADITFCNADLVPVGEDQKPHIELARKLVRRFNEANNEEAGEHWTPRDVVELMADLVFAPIADQIKDATYSCYEKTLSTLIQRPVSFESGLNWFQPNKAFESGFTFPQ